jgi:hypothetical protein
VYRRSVIITRRTIINSSNRRQQKQIQYQPSFVTPAPPSNTVPTNRHQYLRFLCVACLFPRRLLTATIHRETSNLEYSLLPNATSPCAQTPSLRDLHSQDLPIINRPARANQNPSGQDLYFIETNRRQPDLFSKAKDRLLWQFTKTPSPSTTILSDYALSSFAPSFVTIVPPLTSYHTSVDVITYLNSIVPLVTSSYLRCYYDQRQRTFVDLPIQDHDYDRDSNQIIISIYGFFVWRAYFLDVY